MTRRILIALTAISIVLLAFASPRSAQERRVGGSTSDEGRSPKNCQAVEKAANQVVDKVEAEKVRGELISVYNESEALITFLAGYDFIRQSDAMKNYDAVRLGLAKKREQLALATPEALMAQASILPDKQFINRIVTLSQRVRTDAKLLDAIQKTDRFLKLSGQSLDSVSAKAKNASPSRVAVRGVIAAPDYIKPACDYNDPSNYPSGVDLGIASGISIALHLAADIAPGELMVACAMVPNPIHIAFSIAAGVTDQVKNALQAIATNAASCEKIRQNIEDKLKDDRGITTILVNDDFYLTFMYRSVRATLSVATSAGVPTNCGNDRFNEAAVYFNGSDAFIGATGTDRVAAYRLLRAAYQNVGASSCQQ